MESTLKKLVWLYVILLIFEGSLRKWVLPSLANPLLIVRDPVALAIYTAAFFTGRFPRNGFLVAIAVLAVCSVIASFIAGQDNMWVMIYGLRINYGHLPLIWVIAKVLTREDVERLGSFLLIIALPMTVLMVAQFHAPMGAWINRGVGDDAGGQIFGADGKIRPPGFFSFITGPQLFYPLVAAFFLHQISGHRRLWLPLLLACGLAIVIALPVSISRTVMLATGIVGIAFFCCLPFTGGGVNLIRALLLVAIVGVGVSFLPVFQEGIRVFMMRWDTAAIGNDGDAWGSIMGRIMGNFTQPFYWAANAPFFGDGIGVGSNVGSRLLAGQIGFLLVEDEWGKVFLELGPVLGGAFLFLRVAIVFSLARLALRALFTARDNLPVLLLSACAIPIAQNQWAPPTILGFAVLGGGLVLASLNDEEAEDDELAVEDEDEIEVESAEEEPEIEPAPGATPPTLA
ncbi:hypothetical protein K0B96_06935 [Horticoccus luteus]|uniref:O-antigen ligase n=1 Tax=Horticoccus luteus TaxID=2862869 RepID=A0A8F9TW51_9BACT|nr:hypothetical protein [Horticoccus luteus]QYM80339.1 hypothetical protein K0B96_06935 [Horticoccus luteus]